jgi:hypothetical protein
MGNKRAKQEGLGFACPGTWTAGAQGRVGSGKSAGVGPPPLSHLDVPAVPPHPPSQAPELWPPLWMVGAAARASPLSTAWPRIGHGRSWPWGTGWRHLRAPRTVVSTEPDWTRRGPWPWQATMRGAGKAGAGWGGDTPEALSKAGAVIHGEAEATWLPP